MKPNSDKIDLDSQRSEFDEEIILGPSYGKGLGMPAGETSCSRCEVYIALTIGIEAQLLE